MEKKQPGVFCNRDKIYSNLCLNNRCHRQNGGLIHRIHGESPILQTASGTIKNRGKGVCN